MKRMRAIGLTLAGGAMLVLTGCHRAIVFHHPYHTACRAPRTTVQVYHRAPALHTTVYVARPASVHHHHGHR